MAGMESSFVLLARVGGPNQAMLLRARLNSEGIEARLSGEALGPYRLNVGAMAVTEIWIPPDRMEEARLGPSAHLIRSWVWWLVAVILVGVVGYARVLVVGS